MITLGAVTTPLLLSRFLLSHLLPPPLILLFFLYIIYTRYEMLGRLWALGYMKGLMESAVHHPAAATTASETTVAASGRQPEPEPALVK